MAFWKSFILPLLLPVHSLACGGWVFHDRLTRESFTFSADSISTSNDSKKFIQARRSGAFFANGDQIRFMAGDVMYWKQIPRLDDSGKKRFESTLIASYDGSKLKIEGGPVYQIEVKPEPKVRGPASKAPGLVKLTVRGKKGELIGEGKFVDKCGSSSVDTINDYVEEQKYRMISYLVWRAKKLDPRMEPAPSWQW